MKQYIAQIISAVGENQPPTIYILRPPENVSEHRPNISQIRGKTNCMGPQNEEAALIAIGDEVVAGERTTVHIQYVIGGMLTLRPGASVRIVAERHAVATGYTLAREIKKLGGFLAWHTATYFVGASFRIAGRGGIIVRDAYVTFVKGRQTIIPATMALSKWQIPIINMMNTDNSVDGELGALVVHYLGALLSPSLPGKIDKDAELFRPTGIRG